MSRHEAIIFLNNVGITLLQRQQYQESLSTFQDALCLFRYFLMKSCSSTHDDEKSPESSSSSSWSSQDEQLVIQEALRHASERLTASRAQQPHNEHILGQSELHQSQSMLTDPMIILDTSHDDCFSTILHYGSAIDQIDFLIRMNEYSPFGSNECWRLEYVILILNFGVACKRTSETSDDKMESSDAYKDDLHERSSWLFHEADRMISDVLIRITSSIKQRCGQYDGDHMLMLLYAIMVKMMVTAHLGDIMHRNHWSEDNQSLDYYTKFEETYRLFQLSVQEYKKRSNIITTKKHAACA